MRNRGGNAFAQLPGSRQAKAAQFGVSLNTIGSWERGDRQPAPAKRREIEDAGGPPPAWWDEPTCEAPGPTGEAHTAAAGSATPEAIADEADELLADLRTARSLVAALAPEGQEAATQRVMLLEKCASMLKNLQAIRGMLMSERQLLMSPHWQTLEDEIAAALEPWPDAMRAVATALEALRSGG